MFKFLSGLFLGAALLFGYYYLNPVTYDVTIYNNSQQLINELTLTYQNNYCPTTCTLTLKNFKSGEKKLISFQNSGTGEYFIKAMIGDQTLSSDRRTINNSGKQTELISADSIQKRY